MKGTAKQHIIAFLTWAHFQRNLELSIIGDEDSILGVKDEIKLVEEYIKEVVEYSEKDKK